MELWMKCKTCCLISLYAYPLNALSRTLRCNGHGLFDSFSGIHWLLCANQLSLLPVEAAGESNVSSRGNTMLMPLAVFMPLKHPPLSAFHRGSSCFNPSNFHTSDLLRH
jgi:hypothetical protein